MAGAPSGSKGAGLRDAGDAQSGRESGRTDEEVPPPWGTRM